jgi:hypothetical protein
MVRLSLEDVMKAPGCFNNTEYEVKNASHTSLFELKVKDPAYFATSKNIKNK